MKTTFVRTLIALSITAIAGCYFWVTASSPAKNLILEALRLISTGGYVDYVVHGNLGGMPVAIQQSEIEFLEYDDEEVMRRRRQAFPDPRKRTAQDVINSFGFDMTYPQLRILDFKTFNRDANKRKEVGKDGVYVGIKSGSKSPPDGKWLDRIVSDRASDNKYRAEYQPKEELEYGLVANFPPKSRLSTEAQLVPSYDSVYYYHRNDNGIVDVLIDCKIGYIESLLCEHKFTLQPELSGHAVVLYRHGLVEHWADIQRAVKRTVLGFSNKRLSSSYEPTVN